MSIYDGEDLDYYEDGEDDYLDNFNEDYRCGNPYCPLCYPTERDEL